MTATARGIYAVEFLDVPDEDIPHLDDDIYDDTPLATWFQTFLDFLEQPSGNLSLPLDRLMMEGTPLQQRVWKALQNIPPGQTITYGAVAEIIGRPSAVRPVAQACGANPVAVIIPCHRVLRSDGELGGYRWGVQRKQALLKREAQQLAKARAPLR